LAEEYGVSSGAIDDVIDERTWKEMPDQPDRNLPAWEPEVIPGDVLWVREAFRLPECYDHLSPREYVDDTSIHAVKYEAHQPYDKQYGGYRWGRKRPSIFMPRELCRLRLRVEDIRVERLTDIDAADAYEEGINSDPSFEADNPAVHATKTEMIDRFADKWNDIHGIGAWEENPYVWVVEFSKIDTE